MKRLAKDQIALRKGLPPNYFFTDAEDSQSLPDNLTQLLICLAGPEGTPYSQGIWYIRLNIPIDYPQSPPTATFQTRIFHPNVAEETGAVCLETLKRDWDSRLTLKDILITISCLLIQPNPDSALNEKAGALIREDYEAFGRQARLMTRIHAPIPECFARLAQEARRRGEDEDGSELEKAQVSQSQPSNADGKSRHHILKENIPADCLAAAKTNNDRVLKRPLTTIPPSAEKPQETDEHSTSEPRRKSPKHSHPVQPPQDQTFAVKYDGIGDFTKECVFHEEDASIPKRTIFRAQWTSASGMLRMKARVGIRRL